MSHATPAPVHAVQGAICLPTIDSAIVLEFGSQAAKNRTLARFALMSEQNGLILPMGDFTSIEQMVARQWSDHLTRTFPDGLGHGLRAVPMICIDDAHLSVIFTAVSNINCYRAKPVVEALEQAHKGLGWFVYDTAVMDRGLHVYDPSVIGHVIEGRFWEIEEITDEAYAAHLLNEEGRSGTEVTPEVIEELRKQYSYWPSDLLGGFEGAAHLLGLSNIKPPKPLDACQVEVWLGQNEEHPFAQCVRDALTHHVLMTAPDCPNFAYVFQDDEDDTDVIGAMAFVSWDDPGLLIEMAGEMEQLAYQGGYIAEAVGRMRIGCAPEPTDEDLSHLVRATLAYLKRWQQLEKLMSHFPIYENED